MRTHTSQQLIAAARINHLHAASYSPCASTLTVSVSTLKKKNSWNELQNYLEFSTITWNLKKGFLPFLSDAIFYKETC